MKPLRDHCIRCGECCLRSSPSLQAEDVPKVMEGAIPRNDLYAVRAGELVWDNIQGRLEKTDREIVKIREGEAVGCRFYDKAEKGCVIYAHRPIQCAALLCWDPRPFMKVFAGPKATRRDLIQDRNLLRLMEAHEARCGYAELDRHVRAIGSAGERAVQTILGLLKFDHEIRSLTSSRLGLDPREMDLVYGRPLTDTIVMFGLKVVRESDGSFFLTLSTLPTGHALNP